MNNEDLLYIEDANNRKLFYRFTPAAFASNFVPLVVILDEKEKAEALNFEYKMWNVLTPIDDFGHENSGACWLGDKEDFFVKDLLQKLIEKIADEYECEDHIYLYGNSAGAYGAILHGILCKANAVFAGSPQIRLSQANYAEATEHDLSDLLNPKDSFPIFYLCDDKACVESSVGDEIAYFADACKKHGVRVHLDFCPDAGEDESHILKKVLDMFEHVPPAYTP